MSGNKGLGKGLSALMSEAGIMPMKAPLEIGEMKGLKSVSVELLVAGKFQPRKSFDDTSLSELADSIEKNGIMQPILVRPIAGDKYEIIAGERRFRAAKLAKLKEVPVLIRADVKDDQALELALVENIQRQDLNPLEEAAGYQRLIDEFAYTQEKLAAIIGKSRSHIANMLRLLGLPAPVRTQIESGALTMGHARAILGSKEPEILAAQVVEKGLSVRETEAIVRGDAPPAVPKPAKNNVQEHPRPAKSEDLLQLEQMLSDNLGLKVSIHTRGAKAGEVAIQYTSLAELDEILRRLGGSI
ncbi:MAG: ParB/RepB/Spo0J family partition protein [Alphaproteobacteria bacterium]